MRGGGTIRRPRGAIVAAVALAGLTLASAGQVHGSSDPGKADFDAAAALLSTGNHPAAADGFVAVADAHPESVFADDAVFAAAELFEERLGNPIRATELYQRLITQHPDSRNVRAATRRLADLRALLAQGGDAARALAEFTRIKNDRARLGADAAIAQAETLVAQAGGWTGAPDVALWIADELVLAGEIDAAIERYDTIIHTWPDSPASAIARTTRKDADARRQRDQFRGILGTAGLATFVACLALLFLSVRLGAGSWRDTPRALWRLPSEAIYLLPVAAVLAGVAQTGFEPVARAVAQICAGGVVIAWLSGCGLIVAPGRRRALVHAALSVTAIATLCLFSVDSNDLFDVIGQTLSHGPDH